MVHPRFLLQISAAVHLGILIILILVLVVLIVLVLIALVLILVLVLIVIHNKFLRIFDITALPWS